MEHRCQKMTLATSCYQDIADPWSPLDRWLSVLFRCPHIPPDTAIVAVLKKIAQIFLVLGIGITYRLSAKLAAEDRHKEV